MTERLVDVDSAEHLILHTYPITLAGTKAAGPTDADFEKAAEAAAHAHLVPDADLGALTTQMHVCRGGRLEPFGDSRSVLSQTREDLDRAVRESASFLWEDDGRPESGSDARWRRAQEQQLRERAYGLWEQEGRRDGHADEDWRRTRAFQAF